MARITSHTLNAVDGSHAGGIAVTLIRIGAQTPLFASQMDAGGRLSQEIDLTGVDPEAMYELVFATATYWVKRGFDDTHSPPVAEIVQRFQMPDPSGTYHMPIILSPHGYSVWRSS